MHTFIYITIPMALRRGHGHPIECDVVALLHGVALRRARCAGRLNVLQRDHQRPHTLAVALQPEQLAQTHGQPANGRQLRVSAGTFDWPHHSTVTATTGRTW